MSSAASSMNWSNTMTLPELTKTLCAMSGPSGFETPVRQWIAEYIRPFAAEIKTDAMGNLIAVRRCGKPGAKSLLLDAHMDEIGLIVTAVEDGFLKFENIGGVDPRMLPARSASRPRIWWDPIPSMISSSSMPCATVLRRRRFTPLPAAFLPGILNPTLSRNGWFPSTAGSLPSSSSAAVCLTASKSAIFPSALVVIGECPAMLPAESGWTKLKNYKVCRGGLWPSLIL